MRTSTIRSLLWVSDCATLLVTSPHRALMLPVTMFSDLAGNLGRAIFAEIQSFCNDSNSSPFD